MYKTRSFRIGAVIILTALLACTNADSHNAGEPLASTPTNKGLPNFSMVELNGTSVNLQSFAGKKVFVNLWASWCPPCRAEMPSIVALQKKLAGSNTVFVLLSLDENADDARRFVQSQNIELPVYYPREKLPLIFNTDVIPATFIFDEQGALIQQNNGGQDYDTEAYLQLLQ